MERLDYRGISAEGFGILGTLSKYVHDCGLEKSLVELIKLRASQINGCANCVELHANTLRKLGESEKRLQSIVVWWESPEFSEREKAALAWCEAVTLVSKSRVPDDVFKRANAQFTDKELVDLTLGIITINGHNRLAVAFRRAPGS
jgi:AhpD family alkylhydroperoxidase